MAEAEQRRVLIPGGAGYIGSVLTRQLLDRGVGVRVLDSLLYGNGDSLDGVESGDFSFVQGDLRSAEDLRDAFEGVTDVVLLASLVGDPVCKGNPELARETNLDGARRVLEAADEAGVDRFVFASTCSNYGLRSEDDDPASEDDELHPLSLYAETKVEMEREILDRAGKWAFSPTILRLATAYGLSPRMRFDLTVSEFTRELVLGKPLDVYNPDTWRPYCHTEDISAAIATVLEAPREDVEGEVFNTGGDEGNYTKRMIVEAALEALDGDGEVVWTEGGDDARNYRVSFAKIRDRLGFEPRHTVPGAIAELVEALRDGRFDDVEARSLYYRNFELNGTQRRNGEGEGGGDAG